MKKRHFQGLQTVLCMVLFLVLLLPQSSLWAQVAESDASSADSADKVAAVSVTLKRLGDITVPIQRDVLATVVSLNDAAISPQLSAQVSAVSVNVGDKVSKGDVLARLDCRDAMVGLRQAQAAVVTTQARIAATKARTDSTASRIQSAEARLPAAQARLSAVQARLPSAKAQLRLAQTQLQRNQKLRQDALIPVDTLDQARTAFESAQSAYNAALEDVNASQAELASATVEVSSAQADLLAAEADLSTARTELESVQAQQEAAEITVERCQIKAPFAGQITARFLQLGQMATPASPAFQLLQTEALELSANLTADDIRDMASIQNLLFVVEGENYAIQQRAVIGQVIGNTRTQEVRFRITDKHSLPAGKTGRLVWQGSLPAIPSSWVLRREGRLGVLLAKEGKARFYPLPNALEGQPVLTDLSPDTLLIDQNRIRLRDGEAIRPVSAATTEE